MKTVKALSYEHFHDLIDRYEDKQYEVSVIAFSPKLQALRAILQRGNEPLEILWR